MNNTKKFYSEREVYDSTLTYFNGDELATRTWINKYCLKNNEGLFELNPDDMHIRLAIQLHRIETKYPNPRSFDEIYNSLKNFKRIVPQGGPMTGIGNEYQVISLGNCFVVGDGVDSYGGIFKVDQSIAQLEKRRGGVGTDLSNIRPKSSPVKNSAITSTGVVPFMERYSNTTKEVAQDGRRGALMLSLSIKHPDSEDFIDAKLEQGRVTGANISIKIHDDFMKSVFDEESNGKYLQKFPIDSDNPSIVKEVESRRLWNKIIHNAWKSAEPGILFWDNITQESIPSCYGEEWEEKSTNPCGELPLCPYDSCRLLLLNLYGYVINPFTSNARFDFELFKSDAVLAQRLMDDIIDLEEEKINSILDKIKSDPEDEFIKLYELDLWDKIKYKLKQGRRTGLGITAEGDMLAALGLRYGTDEANDFAEEVHKILKHSAYESSVTLAKERGCFPIYNSELEKNNPFILRIKEESPELYSDMVKYGRRNISLLTIAPAGTTSLMTQTTSGIECVFLPVYRRRRKINPQEKNVKIDFIDSEGIAWQEYSVFHHKFEEWLRVNDYDVNVVKTMTSEQIDEIVKKSPYYKATSNDVDWVKKVEMQGRIQKHIDHSISVTVNLPKDVSEDVVSKVYETGWRSKCKGITVYRDGSRDGVLVSNNDKNKEANDDFKDHNAPKRPKRLKGEIHRFQNNSEKWIAVVGIKNSRPFEIFTGKLENGLSNLPNNVKECEVVRNIIEVDEVDDNGMTLKVKQSRYDIEYFDSEGVKKIHTGVNHAFNPEFWNYAKLISGIMRHGMPTIKLYELIGSLKFKDDHINTWKNGVQRVIKRFISDGEKVKGTCPICSSTDFIFQEGCVRCANCGHSKCS